MGPPGAASKVGEVGGGVVVETLLGSSLAAAGTLRMMACHLFRIPHRLHATFGRLRLLFPTFCLTVRIQLFLSVVCWVPHQDRRLLLNYQHLFESEAKVLLGSITIYNNRLPVFNKYPPHCVFKSSFVQCKSFECVVQPDSLPESCGIRIRWICSLIFKIKTAYPQNTHSWSKLTKMAEL